MTEQMTLMIIEPGLRLWGSERALAATLRSLTEAWDKVVLVTPPDAELAEEVRSKPDLYGQVKVVHAPIGNLNNLSRFAKLGALFVLGTLMLRLRPGKVYLNQAGLVRIIRPLTQFFSLPLTVHVRIVEDVPRVTKLSGTSRAPIDLIFISDAMEDSATGTKPKNHTRWHKAYDPYVMAPLPRHISKEAPFVSVGRLSSGKGFHLLVEALARLDLVEVKADIFGAGVAGDDYALNLKEQAESFNANVRFMGFQSNVIARLPAYRFLVSTSQYEPLGRVIMEGWEAGLVPIVYAGSGGAAEMVRKSGAGLMFDKWEAASLVPALQAALDMPEHEHHRLSQAGRAWMAASLDLRTYQLALKGVIY